MASKKPSPTTLEALFETHEMFFSLTDKRGIIETGNSVFLKMAGYPKEELIGEPHNIVRHPDMPKTVFKLLWNTIESNQTMIAYVKNMSSDGNYYWVLAVVFPLENHYFSIRIKPSAEILSKVEDIYKKIKDFEKGKDLNLCIDELEKHIQALGFKNYAEFSVHALLEELQSKDQKLKEDNYSSQISTKKLSTKYRSLELMTKLSEFNVLNFQNYLTEIASILKQNLNLSKTTQEISEPFKNIRNIGINMTLTASQIGQEASVLTVVSTTFSDLALQMQSQMNAFSNTTESFRESLIQTVKQVASARIQIDMIHFFLNELVEAFTKNGASQTEVPQNCLLLIKEGFKNTQKARLQLKQLKLKLLRLTEDLTELSLSGSGLEIIRQTGKIETERLSVGKDLFAPHINEMALFSHKMLPPLKNLVDINSQFVSRVTGIARSLYEAEEQVEEMQRLVEGLISGSNIDEIAA